MRVRGKGRDRPLLLEEHVVDQEERGDHGGLLLRGQLRLGLEIHREGVAVRVRVKVRVRVRVRVRVNPR